MALHMKADAQDAQCQETIQDLKIAEGMYLRLDLLCPLKELDSFGLSLKACIGPLHVKGPCLCT